MLHPLLYIQIFLFLFLSVYSEKEPLNCEKKEKSLAILDTINDSIIKAKRFYPNCTSCNSTSNASDCSEKEKSSAYLGIATSLITDARKNIPTCPEIEYRKRHERPMDCFEVLENGHNVSGVYTIWPRNRIHTNRSLNVFCDMDTEDGGWIVLQRRGNFSPQMDFYQDWNTYKSGFGNISRDFWIGNDNIFYLSNQEAYKIRFDLEDIGGMKGFAVYQTFWIENEESKYKLHVQNYSGNVGDSMTYYDGMMFSTKDEDNDNLSSEDCSKLRQAGWWFNECSKNNPNGLYRPGKKEDPSSIYWKTWKVFEGLAAMEIKIIRM